LKELPVSRGRRNTKGKNQSAMTGWRISSRKKDTIAAGAALLPVISDVTTLTVTIKNDGGASTVLDSA
jgi:hypothetical protein